LDAFGEELGTSIRLNALDREGHLLDDPIQSAMQKAGNPHGC
jgi:hypothetical protein